MVAALAAAAATFLLPPDDVCGAVPRGDARRARPCSRLARSRAGSAYLRGAGLAKKDGIHWRDPTSKSNGDKRIIPNSNWPKPAIRGSGQGGRFLLAWSSLGCI